MALSYLRRLIQGRLDIVHAYLEHPGSDALRDLGDPGRRPARASSPPAPAARRARATCPSCSPPTPKRPTSPPSSTPCWGPMRSADLADMEPTSSAASPAGWRPSSAGCRLDRRALHERIDTLQAELVDRHKTGRASVDGLLT